jgi:hypothetical protein
MGANSDQVWVGFLQLPHTGKRALQAHTLRFIRRGRTRIEALHLLRLCEGEEPKDSEQEKGNYRVEHERIDSRWMLFTGRAASQSDVTAGKCHVDGICIQ